MSANIPDICIKCTNEKGTLIHYLWKCPKIQDFWKDVVKYMSRFLKQKFLSVPNSVCLEDFSQIYKQTKLIDFGLLQARRAIALCWKSTDAPTLGIWRKELSEHVGLERLT